MSAHPWSLEDDEFDAIMALQSGGQAPPREHPVWLGLIEKRLVRLDFSGEPPLLTLTPLGWRYPEPS